jgi:ABC-type nitrate/sulfonate/bicarbonate transport system permease component
MSTDTSSVADEIILQVKEKKEFSVLDLIGNEYFLYGVSFTGFILVWHYVAALHLLGNSLATPMETLREMERLMTVKLAGKNLLEHIWASTRRVFTGFAIGAVLGIPLGLFMALNRYVNAFCKSLFDLLKPMPPLAWISVAILWFGIGESSKIFIIVIGAFVPCVLNAYGGVRIIDEELYDVVRVLGGNRWQEIIQVSFPAALPALFAGVQISLSISWTCVLAAELVSARAGLGWIIIRGMKMSKPELVLGGMVIIAIVATLVTLMVAGCEKLICPWKRDSSNN